MSGFIEFQNVTKEYINGDEVLKAVNDLNLTIDKGEFVVILGPSGSGKSTLLNLLGGLDHVSSGNITVNSHNITGYSDNDLTEYRAHEVGFIFQFYNLIPNLTALENLELISDVIGEKIDGKSYA
jgi:putative ABC transport system ATP-binding protein